MDSQLFFFINMGVAAFFLVWFWLARKNPGREPTQLRLRNQETPIKPSSSPSPQPTKKMTEPSASDDLAVQKAKKLNILFMYNGHDWDAYQVLGLPAGASLPLVTERYQQLIKQADQGQYDFYDAAYQAILKKI